MHATLVPFCFPDRDAVSLASMRTRRRADVNVTAMTDAPISGFEYRVVPAPRKGEKAKGVRSPEGRFALALNRVMNRMGEHGWEFVRADTLPADERVGLTQTVQRYHSLLVFRRALAPQVVVLAPSAEPVTVDAVATPAPRIPKARPVLVPATENVPAPVSRMVAVKASDDDRAPVAHFWGGFEDSGATTDEDAQVVDFLATRQIRQAAE